MFDDQKMGAHEFIMGIKHGVYVLVSDACQFCQDYRKDIEKIDNHYLKIVEVSTDEQKQVVWAMLDRVGFPLTAGYWENELKFVERGQRFGNDFNKIVKFLERFPKEPMSQDELAKLKKDVSKQFFLSLYVFPPETPISDRNSALCAAYRYDEVAIDVDMHLGLPTDQDDRVKALRKIGRKIVIFNVFETSKYSDTATTLIQKTTEDKEYANTTIEHRTIQEAAEALKSADGREAEKEEVGAV